MVMKGCFEGPFGSFRAFGRGALVLEAPAARFLLDGGDQRGNVRGDSVEVAGIKDQQSRGLSGDDRGTAWQAVEQGHLAEETALDKLHRFARQPNLDLAFGN